MTPEITRRKTLKALGGALGAGPLSTTLGQATTTHQTQDQSQSTTQQACNVPVFTDEYLGFSVGRPDGWSIDYTGGTIWLWPENSVTAFVYPVRPQTNISADQLISSYVTALNAGFAGTGGSLSVADGTRLEGSLDGTEVQGEIQVAQVGPDVVIWGGWAPADTWTSWRDSAMATGACYQRHPGQFLTVSTVTGSDQFTTTTWQYVMPTDWLLLPPTGLELHMYGDWNPGLGGWNAHVSRGLLPNLPPGMTTGEFAQFIADVGTPSAGWQLTDWLEQSPVLEATDQGGQIWYTQAFMFSAVANENPFTGQMVVSVANYGSSSIGLVWMREALASEWDRLAAITYVAMSNTMSVTTAPKPPTSDGVNTDDIIMDVFEYRQTVTDEAANQWEETMMGFETVQDQITGEQFWAPLNSYNPASDCDSGYERRVNNNLHCTDIV